MGFTRADLVNAQLLYGTPSAYILGHGTNRNIQTTSQQLIPTEQAKPQHLQIDFFYIFGQVFFLSVSVVMGLIIVSHLGPGINRTEQRGIPAKARSRAGDALLSHIALYDRKGFHVSSVTSDGEPSITALHSVLQASSITLNVLGHGSHVPHAESAIRHLKNKARSIEHSLPYSLPSKWAPLLVTFVAYTINMVPKVNSPDHTPAYTLFTGLLPNFRKQTPHPFGIAGFLQRSSGPTYNSSAPRADYVIWIGTTRNLAGTHRCFNLTTLQEITGDHFTPAPLTLDAINRINRLASVSDTTTIQSDPSIVDPSPPHPIDPNRGVEEDSIPEASIPEVVQESSLPSCLVAADSHLAVTMLAADPATPDLFDMVGPSEHQSTNNSTGDFQSDTPVPIISDTATSNIVDQSDHVTAAEEVGPAEVIDFDFQSEEPADIPSELEFPSDHDQDTPTDNTVGLAEQLAAVRDSQRYNLRPSTRDRHVFSVMTLSEAKSVYGVEAVREAGFTELRNCIDKEVWDCLPPGVKTIRPIPSKLFLTPKMTPTGEFKLLKGRIVGGGHRQDHTMFNDNEISSPTVSLTSVMIAAALAAHRNYHVMTLDHKAAYLNASMKGPEVIMMLTPDVSSLLIELDPSHTQYLRPDKKIAVKLKKALYGCIQSAVLWFNELSSTIEGMGFVKNPYDLCSFRRIADRDECYVLVYVDDLLITSSDNKSLLEVSSTLKEKYGGITTTSGNTHDYLGIRWDYSIPKQVSLSMDGYIKDLLIKFKPFKPSKTPGKPDLFEIDTTSPVLGREKRELFHSAVMTLHYLAKRIRPDVLAPVSFCATRVISPTEQDLDKLQRILGYLSLTATQQLVLKIGDDVKIRAYVDSSFGTYADAKSVSGTVIMLGNAPVYFKSNKQKIVTRSSTEAELVGISDALSQILWTREYMMQQGHTLGPAILYQDNMSTIFLANKGRSTSERTRHIKIRYFFISHYIESHEIVVEYMPTSCMIADILTKPLHGTLFKEMTAAITGHPHNLGNK